MWSDFSSGPMRMTSNQCVRGIMALAVCCIPAIVAAQQPPVVPVIAGRVLATDSDTPLRRARVNVSTGTSRPDPVLTGQRRTVFDRVPGGGVVPHGHHHQGRVRHRHGQRAAQDAQAPLLNACRAVRRSPASSSIRAAHRSSR